MKNRYALLFMVLTLLTSPLLAQRKATPTKPLTPYEAFAFRHKVAKAKPIICYGLKENIFSSVGPPAGFNDKRARRAATSTFIVEYVGYPAEAQAAFQRAVDIWSTLIVSPVPIRIKAFWEPLSGGNTNSVVLGRAGPTQFIGAPDGSQKAQTFYPIALAEKIARRQFNSPDSADIEAVFNSENSWYLGLDARPTAGRSDLVSVVLHELGHGLGFTGGIRGDATTRQADILLPLIYDRFIENAAGTKLTAPGAFTTSAAIYGQVTGRNLFINGPVLQQKTGDRARIFAPATYSTGSTLYHLDEATYAAGTPNSLMTPNINNGEAIQNPGPITLAFFEDMEWKTTSVLHTPINDQETARPLVISARVFSDTGLAAAPPKLFYRQGIPTELDNLFREVNMVRVGTSETYSYTLPAAEQTGRIVYYIRTQDVANRTYSNPGIFLNGQQDYHTFVVGPDRTAPTVKHNLDQSVLLVSQADTIAILAQVTDDRRIRLGNKVGVDTVYVEYQLNGQARPAVPLRLLNPDIFPDSTWGELLTIPRSQLRAGDKISYRIVARDLSTNKNQTLSPATGFYEINIVAPQATARAQYTTDFASTTAASDFALSGFRLETPTGFANPSLNSEHPYRNGADVFNESNYISTLLAPIRVKANPDSSKIRFDEIVLIEPGDAGSVFGDREFYDYVIVEASKDNGISWTPLIDGYDSRDRSEWLTAYNSRTAPGLPQEVNSTATGTVALLKTREFGITDKGTIRPNDVILIRFRLFADQLAHGWGWQIDNLQIQTPKQIILANEPAPLARFEVYPNPATSSVRVMAELSQTATEGTLTLTSPTGQALRNVPVQVRNGKQISEQLDVSQLPTGLYFIQLNAGEAKQVKKIMVTH